MSVAAPTRPGSVTIVVVLAWINAILHLLFGALLILAGLAAGAASVNTQAPGVMVVGIGIVYLIIGLVTAVVAARLGRGGRGSRMLLTVIEVITILGNVTAWISAQTTQATVQSLIGIVIAAVILALLWNRRANEFFA